MHLSRLMISRLMTVQCALQTQHTGDFLDVAKKSATPNPASGGSNSVRIIAGHWRGRRLSFPSVSGLRPTPDRVRETLFNWLQGLVEAEDCVDLFAGSGACGFEAISRGARSVVFVDVARDVTGNIQAELNRLGAKDLSVTQVVTSTAEQWMLRAEAQPARFGLVFLDPPFADNLLVGSCKALEASGLLKPRALIYVESGQVLPRTETHSGFPANWALVKQGRAGSVYFGLYRRNPGDKSQ
jgi:16S rRNA (guanine966-N2)-methyltransferase